MIDIKVCKTQNDSYYCFPITHTFLCVKETSKRDDSFTHTKYICFYRYYETTDTKIETILATQAYLEACFLSSILLHTLTLKWYSVLIKGHM